MKIVKEGKWNLPWTTQIDCPTCEAVLLVEEPDVKPSYNAMTYECACVICGKTFKLADKLIAQRVREAADKTRRWSRSDD